MKGYTGPVILVIALLILAFRAWPMWEIASSSSYSRDAEAWNFLFLLLIGFLYLLGSGFLIAEAPTPASRFLAFAGTALGLATAGIVGGAVGHDVFRTENVSIGPIVTGALGALATLATTAKSIVDTLKAKA